MFQGIEYNRSRSGKAVIGKITRRKVILEFPTFESARKFIEGKNQTVILYPKSYIKEAQL